jgi:hypothetical protein
MLFNKNFGGYRVNGVEDNRIFNFSPIHDDGMKIPFSIDIMNSSIEDGNVEVMFRDNSDPSEEAQLAITDSLTKFFNFLAKSMLKDFGKPITSYPLTGESYITKPVFYHYRSATGRNENYGGVSLAVMYEELTDSYIFGVSICADNDTYVKKFGNEIAWKQIVDSPYIVPVIMFEEALNTLDSLYHAEEGTRISIEDPVAFIRSINRYRLMKLLRMVANDDSAVTKNIEVATRKSLVPR